MTTHEPCPRHGVAVLDDSGRCLPSCGHGWSRHEMVQSYIELTKQLVPDPSPQDHFADWLERWFERHAVHFGGKCDAALAHECAGMLAGDMHAAGFAAVRIDDIQIRHSYAEVPSGDPYPDIESQLPKELDEFIADREAAAEHQKMAEQQEHERR